MRAADLAALVFVAAAASPIAAAPAAGPAQPAPGTARTIATPHGLLVVRAPSTTVPVGAGSFAMGALDEEIESEQMDCTAAANQLVDCSTLFNDEMPARTVFVSAFAIDRTEVSREAYEKCVLAGACDDAPLAFPSPDSNRPQAPITFVTWSDAHRYCAFRGERLPTEAEWEKAARGEGSSEWPWGDQIDLQAFNHGRAAEDGADLDASDGSLLTADVGTTAGDVSPYGALDMAGNVMEWVADWYGTPDSTDLVDPQGPDVGEERVVRGGSFLEYPFYGRGEWRWHALPNTRGEDLGFRCAR
jgi:formylglycine-generating enzyme required for sulfatase activity